MKYGILAGLCLALCGCADDISRSEDSFYPVHVGASPQFLASGVSASLADAVAWAQGAPMVRGGQELATMAGRVRLQRVRYDAHELALVEPVTPEISRMTSADVAGPVEWATGCRVAPFDWVSSEPVFGPLVLPVDCFEGWR